MARKMEMDGNLEELGVEKQRVELWIGIKILEPNLIRKNLNLKLGGCSGTMGLH
jgi:hypothetical protein